MHFYDNLVSQVSGFNIFLRPSDEITTTDGVIPDILDEECKKIMGTALYSKFNAEGTIASTYTDAHNLLATTTDGFVFLQLLQQ